MFLIILKKYFVLSLRFEVKTTTITQHFNFLVNKRILTAERVLN